MLMDLKCQHNEHNVGSGMKNTTKAVMKHRLWCCREMKHLGWKERTDECEGCDDSNSTHELGDYFALQICIWVCRHWDSVKVWLRSFFFYIVCSLRKCSHECCMRSHEYAMLPGTVWGSCSSWKQTLNFSQTQASTKLTRWRNGFVVH